MSDSKAMPPPESAAGQAADTAAAAAAAKEKAKKEKEERRRLKEMELKMRNIAVGDQPAKKTTKAERRAIQEQQRAVKQETGHPGAAATGTSGAATTGGGGARDGREPRPEAGRQHAGAAGARHARVNVDKYTVPEDRRMYLYEHLSLPDHPPSSAQAQGAGRCLGTGPTTAEHSTGDPSAFAAGITNAAFPPGPQVVVGMARDDYVAAEANTPRTVRVLGTAGKPVEAVLRDAVSPFASGPGQRKFLKPSATIAVHPRIKEVGLRMATMEISGSNARTVAMLLAFADVIADYSTPPRAVLTQHLTSYLSLQIDFLVFQRDRCIGMANAIRWLKAEIIRMPNDLKDDEAKRQLAEKIDGYIKERITAAGDIIAEAGAQKIQDGDVVLTYGASSTVQNLLVAARRRGRRFQVIVVDSRPVNEGRRLVRKLVEAGFSSQQSRSSSGEDGGAGGADRTELSDGVTYAPITALSSLMRDASKVLLSAEAFFANGTMLSRVGTAMVALAAHSCHVPVIVTCETYKFNERVQLDAVVNNELGVPDALMYKTGIPDAEPVGPQSDPALSAMEYSAYARDKYSPHPRWNNRNALRSETPAESTAAGKKAKAVKAAKAAAAAELSREAAAVAKLSSACPLNDWRTSRQLRLLNLTQDVTPPEFVSVIITEVGMVPTTSIPVVLREYKNQI
ncbi:hypothetical protein LPJ61_001467 [Coemansia biformis]|uniref:Translation initiation factor eIF2B subunit delta n=1 Tax=Coemansia biformis TaxID=1286918 RepID=A0A9W7Y9Y3_9FUNG|nr:hypothetical protein LPJ61_001467 [Coemansia biformis]